MIIGITGTLGAGKGTVATYLVTQHGFKYFSARDLWNEEIARRGLLSNRDTMTEVANDLRAAYGSDYFVKTALTRAQEQGGDIVLESIRSTGEAELLKSRGAMLWAVDADIQTRYERVEKRKSETDSISFDKFVADEQRETTSTDPNKQNLAAVRDLADTVLLNNSTEEELFAQVEAALRQAQGKL
jgi:dephospho-CoA kinase